MPGGSTWHELDRYIDLADWTKKCKPRLGFIATPSSSNLDSHMKALRDDVDPTIGSEAAEYLPTIEDPRDALVAYLLASRLCRTIATTLPTAKDYTQTIEFSRALSKRHPILSTVCADAEAAFRSRMSTATLDLPINTGTAGETSASGLGAKYDAMCELQHHAKRNALFHNTLKFRNVIRVAQNGDNPTYNQMRDMMMDLM